FASSKDVANKPKMERELNKYLASGLVSKSARANFIQNLRGRDKGSVIAAAALGVFLGSTIDPAPERQDIENRYAAFRGRVAMALFDGGVQESAAPAIETAGNLMVSDFSTRMQRLSSENDTALALIKTDHEEFRKGCVTFEERSEQTL